MNAYKHGGYTAAMQKARKLIAQCKKQLKELSL